MHTPSKLWSRAPLADLPFFWENRPERVAIPKKFYIGLRPGFIIVKQVVVDWVTGMVWDPNQEGCIDKFGGKILLSANQKKNITSTAKKISESVVWSLTI